MENFLKDIDLKAVFEGLHKQLGATINAAIVESKGEDQDKVDALKQLHDAANLSKMDMSNPDTLGNNLSDKIDELQSLMKKLNK